MVTLTLNPSPGGGVAEAGEQEDQKFKASLDYTSERARESVCVYSLVIIMTPIKA
jgi:hypothetical protein